MSSVQRSGFLRTKSMSGEQALTGTTATCRFYFRRYLAEQEENLKGAWLSRKSFANASFVCKPHELHEYYNMRRSIGASRMRMEPGENRSRNVLQMPERVWPYRPLSSKITGVSSLETVLKIFWEEQMEQLDNLSEFNRQNHLPLCRVRKILKSDPEVKKVSRDVPALFSKASEYFIQELTLRAWMHTQSCTRETIRSCDVLHAVRKSEIYEFLTDLVPFGPHCVMHQGVPEHAQPEQVLRPAKVILPDMNVPIDMDQAEQENPIAEPFTNNKGFDLNCDLSEHDSAGES